MTRLLSSLILVSSVLSTQALAEELNTPPLGPSSANGDNFAECVATNIGPVTQKVLIQGFDSEGAIAAQLIEEIEPDHTRGLSLSESPGPTGSINFCRFSFKGKPGWIKAAIHVLDGGGDGIIAALAAD